MRLGGKELAFGAAAGEVTLQLRIGGMVLGSERLGLDEARKLRAELDLAIHRAYQMAVTAPPPGGR